MTQLRALLLAILMVALGRESIRAQDAALVYEQHAHAVAKVEVLERSTGAPAGVGTAFFVRPSLLLTNYHVVRELVYDSEAYRLQLEPTDGIEAGEVQIVAVDPPNDLAVLRVNRTHPSPLLLHDGAVPNGEVLYSLGHPADLQTSVVEGVFNGSVEAAAVPRFHFSGSVNPGMSGGPTVRADGAVVGINVSTAGNQLSFLVPATAAADLVETASGRDGVAPEDLQADATSRFADFQESFFASLADDGFSSTTLGAAVVPSGSQDRFDCSASPADVEDDRYEQIEFLCFTEDSMLLGPDGSYDLIYMEHYYLAGESLPRLAFNSLLSDWYATIYALEAPEDDDMGEFECKRANVEEGLSTEMLVVFCARQHLRHPDLYDVLIRSAMLGGGRRGVVSTLSAAPISFERATQLTQRWLGGFRWTN